LWKNIAQSENYAEIQGLFANVKKNFLATREKNFSTPLKSHPKIRNQRKPSL
jgi:hypothetical protein